MNYTCIKNILSLNGEELFTVCKTYNFIKEDLHSAYVTYIAYDNQGTEHYFAGDGGMLGYFVKSNIEVEV